MIRRRRYDALSRLPDPPGMGRAVIHYHGLPITPLADMLRAIRRRHAMVSFEDHRQIEEAAEVCQSVVLDNGAFSAWQQGKVHNFAGYQCWAARWLRHSAVESAVIPDVIDGTEAQNDELLAEWALPRELSVPVYHFHESLERLERLTAYPRVALGSSGQYSDPGSRAWWARMAEVMEVLCDSDDYPLVKLHGLRMLDPVLFSHLPLSSADSCNVARTIGIDQAWTGPYVPKSKWAVCPTRRRRLLSSNIETPSRTLMSAWNASPRRCA
jgi:hypothetical protein